MTHCLLRGYKFFVNFTLLFQFNLLSSSASLVDQNVVDVVFTSILCIINKVFPSSEPLIKKADIVFAKYFLLPFRAYFVHTTHGISLP